VLILTSLCKLTSSAFSQRGQHNNSSTALTHCTHVCVKRLAFLAAGIFVNLSVRKPLVIDYKLPYPTGTATGVMINSFFTNGDLAKQQAMRLLKLGIAGFLFDFWTWFFDGNCATYLQALPNFTYSINAMPNLGYRHAPFLTLSIP
jgi:uncharacterized oligopeptide transporter (OPT) family protein